MVPAIARRIQFRPMSSSTPPEAHTPPRLPTREGYDRWSEVYDCDDNPLVAMEQPRVDEVMGDVRGLEIVELGCGTGRQALRLAKAGARVTALDFSDGMLARARQKAEHTGADVRWIVHDLSRPAPLQSGTFDRVLCALVLDHVYFLDHLFAEMARLVRPCPATGRPGRIVVSVMHPAMMLKGVQARFVDPATGIKTLVDSVPNQISDYVMAATRAGLRFTHMSEHAGDAALAANYPRLVPYVGWPVLLMMALEPGRWAAGNDL